jgi:uncharacterized protein (DUF924 family)
MSRPEEILEFWFGKPGEEGYAEPRPVWFAADEAFDAAVRERFAADFAAAAAGELAAWEETPEGSLALLLLLDQCSNNLFRGEAGAFATDAMARQVARNVLAKGFDQHFPEVLRWFCYLPFEHSEDAADQELSVALFRRLEPTEVNQAALDYAIRHKRVIDRFGRFPNRNAAMGRESTPEERAFLASAAAPF